MPKGARPLFCATPSTRIFVEVPISVIVPPKIEAKESGISSLDGASPIDFARLMATGIKMTTTGVLLMKADNTITPAIIAMIATIGDDFLASCDTSRPPASITPVRSSAADRTNIAAIVIGAEFENTPSTSFVFRMPVRSSAPMARSAVMSTGNFSFTNPKKTITTRTRTNPISNAEFAKTELI